jgi:hypothetical protein
LRPYLEEAFDPAEPGTAHVITSYRDRNANLRNQLNRIIVKAGLTPWSKLFHNLRATRQTELTAAFRLHVVCRWIGNKQAVAAEHYLQVTDADFEKAAKNATGALQNPVQQPAATARMDSQGRESEKPQEVLVQPLAALCDTTRNAKAPRARRSS